MILKAHDAVKVGETIYFVSNEMNILCSYNNIEHKIRIISIMPTERPLSSDLIARILYWEDCLVLVPINAGCIWIYSINKDAWTKINICYRYKLGGHFTYKSTNISGDTLYLFGGYIPSIIKINLLTKDVEYFTKPFEKLKVPLQENSFIGEPIIKDDLFILASCIDNAILIYKPLNNSFEWIKIGSDSYRYSGIEYDGRYYWLSPRRNTPIIKWNGRNQIKELYTEDIVRSDETAYVGIVKDQEGYYIPANPISKNGSIRIDENEKIIIDEMKYYYYKKNDKDEFISQDNKGVIKYKRAKREYTFTPYIEYRELYRQLTYIGVDIKQYMNFPKFEDGEMSLNDFLTFI